MLYKNLIRLITPLVLVSQLATPVFSAAVVYAETTEPTIETETDVGPVNGDISVVNENAQSLICRITS